MKRLLFYIMAILVMAAFTALLQQGKQRNKFSELKSSSLETQDSLNIMPVLKDAAK